LTVARPTCGETALELHHGLFYPVAERKRRATDSARGIGGRTMAKKIINLLILLPLGIILIIFCVANRQSVTLAFNPFRPEDQVLSLSAPFFVFMFIALIIGMLAGSP
jgi:uncharacterized integral membrane protein